MKKINNYISVGLLFNGIFLLGQHTNFMPEFLKGLFAGLGISLILIGCYAENHDMSKFKNYKKELFSKIFSK